MAKVYMYVKFSHRFKHGTTELRFIPSVPAFPLHAAHTGTLNGESALNFQDLSSVPLARTATAESTSFHSLHLDTALSDATWFR